MKELGYPEIGGVIWFWLAGPKNLCPRIVDRVNREVHRYLAAAPAREIFERDALLTVDADSAALTSFIAAEINRWSVVFRQIEGVAK
jgi:tripartite-type tricarboxylate transporter receptor subunit TctC